MWIPGTARDDASSKHRSRKPRTWQAMEDTKKGKRKATGGERGKEMKKPRREEGKEEAERQATPWVVVVPPEAAAGAFFSLAKFRRKAKKKFHRQK